MTDVPHLPTSEPHRLESTVPVSAADDEETGVDFVDPWEPAALEWDDDLRMVFDPPGRSREVHAGQEPTPYAYSHASRELQHELRLYARRRFQSYRSGASSAASESSREAEDNSEADASQRSPRRPHRFGRSVLVSGVRGSGKTATVYWVIRDLQRELNRREQPIRLLPVMLSASTFLDAGICCEEPDPCRDDNRRDTTGDSESAQTAPLQTETQPLGTSPQPVPAASVHFHSPLIPDVSCQQTRNPDTPGESSSGKGNDHPQFRFLETLCGVLHRTVIREFLRSGRARLDEQAARSSHRVLPAWLRASRLETLAQLEHDLEDFMHPARLRDYWETLGFLHDDGSGSALFDARKESAQRLPPGQSIQEVSLLATLNRMYLRLIGEYRTQSSSTNQDSQSYQSGAKQPLLNVDQWRPIVAGLLGGIVSGAGAAVASNESAITLIAAASGAIIVSLLSALIPTRSSQQQFASTTQFERDFSLRTLHLEIPRLIDGLFQVGLCPVFIIDELDKLPRLPEQMECLLTHLKQFFATDGFFIFLTHREFVDSLEHRERTDPLSSTTTWFNRRLFIEFQPWDVRRFIRHTIRPSRNLEPGTSEYDEVTRALAVWEYSLLFGNSERMADLHSSIRHLQEAISCGRQTVKTALERRSLISTLFQLASDIAIQRMLQQRKLRHNRGDLQLAIRVLSLPGQAWQRGSTSPQLPLQRNAGLDSLFDRMERDLRDTYRPQQAAARAGKRTPATRKKQRRLRLFSETVRDALEHQLRAMFELLAADDQIPLLEAARVLQDDGGSVFEVLREKLVGDIFPLVELETIRLDKTHGEGWSFRYAPDGRQATGRSAVETVTLESARSAIRRIALLVHDVEGPGETALEWSAMSQVFEPLSRADLIDSDPPWTNAATALDWLDSDAARKADSAVVGGSESVVVGFGAMLASCEPGLLLGMAIASGVGRFSSHTAPVQRLETGLAALRRWLPRDAKEATGDYGMRLRPVLEAAVGGQLIDGDQLQLQLAGDDPVSLADWIRKTLQQVASDYDQPHLNQATFRCWNVVFESRTPTRKSLDPGSTDAFLICEASRVAPATLFSHGAVRPTIRDWSRLFLASIDSPGPQTGVTGVPAWSGAVALRKLGFPAHVALSLINVQATRMEAEDNDLTAAMESSNIDGNPRPGEAIRKQLESAVRRADRDVKLEPDTALPPSPGDSEVILADLILAADGLDDWKAPPQQSLSGFVPDLKSPVLCLTDDEARQLGISLGTLPDFKLKVGRVFVEEPDPRTPSVEYTEALVPILHGRATVIAVQHNTGDGAQFTSREWPRKLAELVAVD